MLVLDCLIRFISLNLHIKRGYVLSSLIKRGYVLSSLRTCTLCTSGKSQLLQQPIRFIGYTTTSKINQHKSHGKYINAREEQIKQGT